MSSQPSGNSLMNKRVPKKDMLYKARLCLQIFLAHYRKSPLQAGAIIIGIILAVTLLTGVRAINENAKRSYSVASEQLSQQANWFITPKAGQQWLDENVYFDLRRAGFSQSLAVVEGTLLDNLGNRWQVQGSDLVAALTVLNNENTNTGSRETPSLFDSRLPITDMVAGKPIVLMSQQLEKKVSKRSEITLAGQSLRVVSVSDDFSLGNRVLMDISLAQRLLRRFEKLSYIALFDLAEQDQKPLTQLLGDRAVLSQSDNGENLTALTESFHLNLTAMSMLAFIVGLFIAYNGVRYSLLKRQRLFIQLQQIGMAKIPLLLALFFELFGLILIGSVIGFIAGLQLSHWLHPMVSVTLEQLYDARILPGIWRWSWLWQAILLTMISTALACGSLFTQLLRQPLAHSAGQYSQQNNAERTHRIQFIIAIVLAATSAFLMPFSDDYQKTMVLLGLVVIAIPLSLPLSLSILVNLVAKVFRKGLIGYQIAETKELVSPLSLAMMAMLLALTANISMNTLVGSFESTLTNWLNVRLHADLYVRPAQSEISKVEQYLHNQPDVTAVYKQFYLSSQYGGLPIIVGTKDPETMEKTAIFKRSASDVWSSFYDGNSVIISEPMAIRSKLSLGDSIHLHALPSRSFNIAGIFYDYGNPYGEVLVSQSVWTEYGFSTVPAGIGVGFDGEPEMLRQRLKKKFGMSDALIYDQQQIKQRAISIFNKTFSITQVLNSLTLLVASVGLFSACFMLTQARVAPIARLYSLGVSQQRLTYMVISQMLSIVLLTCLVALPTGAMLGYLLINKVTLQAFGWSIAMLWNWPAYFEVVGIALLSSLLAVALPIYLQTKRPLVSSLQSEVI
ncbi:ABC transporter permease [Vibrio algarum]|uniref:ABC transporter permease n=1 Tax=Vibrio algarum TaxID=3020714 RepID=A0ABT4YRT5_9VIBR|nr:ABC transporter permease [Vibrio sp. KJ40-1]MDB1124195.1 ABC transporter permease [Vibrio sp. KJ40-1]